MNLSQRSSAPPARARRSDGALLILAAAEALFAERGYNAVPVSAIATRAGVSKANVFHHFKTKDRLYLTVLRRACGTATQVWRERMAGDGAFGERIRHAARAHLLHLLEQEDVSRLILREVVENGPRRGPELAEQVFDEDFAGLVQVIREAQHHGELRREADPAVVASLLLGADVFFFLARSVLIHMKAATFAVDPERYSALLTDYLLTGLAPNDAAGPDAKSGR